MLHFGLLGVGCCDAGNVVLGGGPVRGPDWQAAPGSTGVVTLLPIPGELLVHCIGRCTVRFDAGLLTDAECVSQCRYSAGQVAHERAGLHPLRGGEFLATAVELPQHDFGVRHAPAQYRSSMPALFPPHFLAACLGLVQLMANRPMALGDFPLPLGGRFHSLPSARCDAVGNPP